MSPRRGTDGQRRREGQRVDVIGELLRASLLSEVGDDQERARRVRDAAKRLGEDLAHGSRPLVPHCLGAAVAAQLQAEFEGFVKDLVNVAGLAATEAEKRAHTLLKEFAGPLGTKLRDALAAVERGNDASRLRINLLWWRQTAYSERLSKPYADLEAPAAVAAAAAADLHAQVPDLAPVVVEHLLADLVSSVTPDARVDAANLGAAGRETGIGGADPVATPAVLLDVATGAAATSPLLPDGQTLAAARAAVLLFRDLQARRLTPARAAAEPDRSAEQE